jgi:hypothetical protein
VGADGRRRWSRRHRYRRVPVHATTKGGG